MPLILGLIGFIFASIVAFAWVVMWLIAAVVWLLWPLALLLLGGVMWRHQSRRWQQFHSAATARPGPSRSFFKNSGNTAFDEHRDETLHRLDEERERFHEFLERLRRSKDKQAFDRFMSERRSPRRPMQSSV